MNRLTAAVIAIFSITSIDAFAFSGNLSNAIFVDAVTGSDGNDGSINSPKASISAALAIATAGKNIYVSKGTYPEQVAMVSGVSVYGQYDRSANWIADPSNTTTINGSANPVFFSNVSGETHFEGFQVQAANAAATQSSYAVRVDSSTGPIFIRYNTLVAGVGGQGLIGGNGSVGPPGGNGGSGLPGSCDNNNPGGPGGLAGSSTCSVAGGAGGAGGDYGANSGVNGQAGVGGAAGGPGGGGGDPGSPGGLGNPGSNGTNGANATRSSSAVGSIGAGLYTPVITAPGGPGTNGKGGGGGGGGGGQGCTFCNDGNGNGGGGGGAGGCGAGVGGTSGTGGGGSFALFVSASVVTVDANYLVVSQAGAGGSGGNGASGGPGGGAGSGATVCTGEVGAGGNGGSGGKGGDSGAGAGGPGGPAIAIFGTAPGSVTIGTNRYSLPGTAPAGSGGTGGNGGLVGVVRHGYPSDFADPGPATLNISNASLPMPYVGTSTLIVPVSLGPVTNGYVSVGYQTIDGSAVAGQNYVATSGTLTFDPWATLQKVRVTIIGTSSATKTFTVQLSAPAGALLNTATATGTILYNNDVIFRNDFE